MDHHQFDVYFSFECTEIATEMAEALTKKLAIKICLAHNLKSIKNCHLVLAFITDAYAKDANCMSELRYSQKLHKKMLLFTPSTEIIPQTLTHEFAYLSESIFISDKLKLAEAIASTLGLKRSIDTQTHAIGIDLGATSCCVAIIKHGKCEIIGNELAENATDSYVAFTRDQGILIGSKAKSQLYRNSANTIYNFKSMLEKNTKIQVEYNDEMRLFCAEEITTMMLCKLKETAEAHLGGIVADAVITVPAKYNQLQLKSLRNAAEAAGLHLLRIISDTSAASFAYELSNRIDESLALVFDLGAASLSVAIVAFDKGIIEVRSTAADFSVGGEFFDAILVDFFAKEIRVKLGIDVSGNNKVLLRLRGACERLKCSLSTAARSFVEIYSIQDDVDFFSSISRDKFEEISEELMKRVLNAVESALEDAGVAKEAINDVVLVGGGTKIPKIQRILSDFFGGGKIDRSLNANEAVAFGAAIQAAVLRGVNEAPIQDLLLLDVMPQSIGVEGARGRMQVLVKSNTTVPVKQQGVLRLTEGCRGDMVVRFFEGEGEFVRDNCFLGEIEIKGLGGDLERFSVTLDVDANLEIFVVIEDVVSGRMVSRNLTAWAENSAYEPICEDMLPVLSVLEINE